MCIYIYMYIHIYIYMYVCEDKRIHNIRETLKQIDDQHLQYIQKCMARLSTKDFQILVQPLANFLLSRK